jgi:hypothetical protein
MKVLNRERVAPINAMSGDSIDVRITIESDTFDVCTVTVTETVTVNEIVVYEGDQEKIPPFISCDTLFASFKKPRRKRRLRLREK